MSPHPSSAINSYGNVSFMWPESIKPVWKQHLSQFLQSQVYIFLSLFAESRWWPYSFLPFVGRFHPVQGLGVCILWRAPRRTPPHLIWEVPCSTCGLLSQAFKSREEMLGHRDLLKGPHDLQGAETDERTIRSRSGLSQLSWGDADPSTVQLVNNWFPPSSTSALWGTQEVKALVEFL